MKYAQHAHHNKGLLSKEKDFARALSQLGKDIPPTLVSLVSLPHIREKVYQQESGLQGYKLETQKSGKEVRGQRKGGAMPPGKR